MAKAIIKPLLGETTPNLAKSYAKKQRSLAKANASTFVTPEPKTVDLNYKPSDNFVKAEKMSYRGFNRLKYLKDNAKDLLYGKAQWFMEENKVKRSGVIRTTTASYDWVTDNLSPESSWKK